MSERVTHWRCAFITGGASGIGQELARRLAADGTDVAVFDLQAVDGKQAGNGRVRCFQADITDAPGLRAAVADAVDALGPPDLAVNSAGINTPRSFHLLTDELYRRILDVNLWGSRNFAFAVLPHMGAGGQLVLMSSFGGLAPVWSYGGYSATKFGVIGLGGVLRIESKPRGIGVSVVCPPNVPTPMSLKEEQDMHPAQRALKDVAGTLPLEYVARAILDAAGRRKFLVIPGFRAKLLYVAMKLAPMRLFHWIGDRVVRRELQRHPDAFPDWRAEGSE